MFWRTLVGTAAQTAAAAIAGSLATSSGVRSQWYENLQKPDFQPPPVAFPVAWTVLYADIALTSAAVLTELEEQVHQGRSGAVSARRGYRRALTVNLALNAGWCWTFFSRRDTSLATVTALALTLSSADLVRRAARSRGTHALALAPYAAWCGFATALSGSIHDLNR